MNTVLSSPKIAFSPAWVFPCSHGLVCTLLNAQVGISADFQSSLSVEQFPPSNSSLLDHPGLSACSSQLRESAILLLGSSSLHYYLESLSRSIIGLILYLSMPDVQRLENHCFIYFGFFFFFRFGVGVLVERGKSGCSGMEAKSGPCYPILAKSGGSPHMVF